MSKGKIAILLVLHNQEIFLPSLLESLSIQTDKNFRIYAYNNNSKDKSTEILLNYYPNARIVSGITNKGFGYANNVLAKEAIADKCEYLFILNSDMRLEKDLITVFNEYFINDENIIAIAPLIYYVEKETNNEIVQCFADKANFFWGITSSLFKNYDNINYLPNEIVVNTLHGGCFMIKANLFKNLAVFSEDNFMYGEELDLCYRLKSIKGKLIATQKTHAWHYHDYSKQNIIGNCFQIYYISRNRYLFFYRYGKYLSLIVNIIKDVIVFPARYYYLYKKGGVQLVKYNYLGLINGILNKKGNALLKIKTL